MRDLRPVDPGPAAGLYQPSLCTDALPARGLHCRYQSWQTSGVPPAETQKSGCLEQPECGTSNLRTNRYADLASELREAIAGQFQHTCLYTTAKLLDEACNATVVKPYCCACAAQITTEQILRESKELQEVDFKPPKQKISSPAELAEYRLRKRKEFEDKVRRVRWNQAVWVKVDPYVYPKACACADLPSLC